MFAELEAVTMPETEKQTAIALRHSQASSDRVLR
jgi:hypothetical protein